jgi:two-component system OmpR family response regulator
LRVLVVEDEPLLSRQLASALGQCGYAVDCAGDGEQADFLARTEQYDAVVLDLGLPRIDGLTLLRRWRESGIVAPVLILTARGSWHEKVQGIDGGADDYVAKPFQEAAPGSGLGLAIVRDLSEIYGGSISLDDSPLGGLRARIALPAS